MTSLSARLDALIERLVSCQLPTPASLALEDAAESVAHVEASKGKRNKVLTELFWSGRKGKDLDSEGRKKALQDLEGRGAIKQVKNGYKLTKKGVEDFAAISKKKAELVEKGVRRHASMDDAKRAIRASLQATLAIQAYERMANPPTAPIYDQVFTDGVAALDATYPTEPNTVVVDVYNIGDEEYGEEDWVVDVGWAHVENNHTRTKPTWWTTERYPLPTAVRKLLNTDANEPLSRQEAFTKAKKIVQLLNAEGLPVKSKVVTGSVSVAQDRNSSVVVTIPIPDKYAKRFPDPVMANHGHTPHLSVLFIGNKGYLPGEMSQVLAAVRSACKRLPPFRLYVDPNSGLKDFGPNEEKGEKALWLPARSEPRGEVERLHRALRIALEQEGIDVGHHGSFVPHVTWSYVSNTIDADTQRKMEANVSDRFKEGFYFDVRHLTVSMPDGTSKTVALSPIPRKK